MPRRPSTHVDSPAAVGRRLRTARLAAGLSQRDLSFDGCTAAYVSRIEAGARTPSYQILREFAKRLGVTADHLATGDDGVLADPLVEAEIALRLGELDRAGELYERALRDDEEATRSRAEGGLGRVALARGDLHEAVERLSRALSGGELPAQEQAAAAESLGRTYCLQGRFDEAFAILRRVLEQAKERGDRPEAARFGVLLATAYADGGSIALAEGTLADALADARAILDPALRAELYWSQSSHFRSRGDADLAAEYAQLAAATLRSAEHATAARRAVLLRARLENDGGDGAGALSSLGEADGMHDGLAPAASIERARALALLGRAEEALSLMSEVVSGLDGSHPAAAAGAYASAAAFFRALGDDARALELYGLAVERAPAAGRHVADALTAMAEIREEQGDADEALRLLKSALAARNGAPSV